MSSVSSSIRRPAGSRPASLSLGRDLASDNRGDATALRRRVLTREATADGLGRVRTLSQAVKAYALAVTVAPDGRAVVAWHEEEFPRTITIILPLESGPEPRRSLRDHASAADG